MRSRPVPNPDIPDWLESFATRYIAAGYWAETTFAEAFAEATARHGPRIAVCDGEMRRTYDQLLDQSRRLAAGFQSVGLAAGDNVLVHLPNGIAFLETCLALFQLGVRPILALPAHRLHEIHAFCRFANVKAYIGAARIDGFDPGAMIDALVEEGVCGLVFRHGSPDDQYGTAPLYRFKPIADCVPCPDDVACFQL